MEAWVKTDNYSKQVIKKSMSSIDYIQSLEGDVKSVVVSVYTDSLQKSHCMYNGWFSKNSTTKLIHYVSRSKPRVRSHWIFCELVPGRGSNIMAMESPFG